MAKRKNRAKRPAKPLSQKKRKNRLLRRLFKLAKKYGWVLSIIANLASALSKMFADN